jgi:hypothetical protein
MTPKGFQEYDANKNGILVHSLAITLNSCAVKIRRGFVPKLVMSTVPSVRDHCGRGRTAKSPSVRGQDGPGAVFLRQDIYPAGRKSMCIRPLPVISAGALGMLSLDWDTLDTSALDDSGECKRALVCLDC